MHRCGFKEGEAELGVYLEQRLPAFYFCFSSLQFLKRKDLVLYLSFT